MPLFSACSQDIPSQACARPASRGPAFLGEHKPESARPVSRIHVSHVPDRVFSTTSPDAPSFLEESGVRSKEPGLRIGAPPTKASRLRTSDFGHPRLFSCTFRLGTSFFAFRNSESGLRALPDARHPAPCTSVFRYGRRVGPTAPRVISTTAIDPFPASLFGLVGRKIAKYIYFHQHRGIKIVSCLLSCTSWD